MDERQWQPDFLDRFLAENSLDAVNELRVCSFAHLVISAQLREDMPAAKKEGRCVLAQGSVADKARSHVGGDPGGTAHRCEAFVAFEKWRHLPFDSLGMGPVVGVLEADELALGTRHREVADLVSASVVCHAQEFDAVVECFGFVQDRVKRRWRAIVHHEDLKIAPRLLEQGLDRPAQTAVRLEGGHDDCHERLIDGRHHVWGVGRDAVERLAVFLWNRDRE